MPVSEVFNGCCMDIMARYPDGFFDLAIVDPPYGIGLSGYSTQPKKMFGKTRRTNGSNFAKKEWDASAPTGDYFAELCRVSKNQIIWGGNYFTDHLPPSKGWIFWYKHTNGQFADGELAWSSFNIPLKVFDFTWNGLLQENMANKETRIHPTQKPAALYRWLLQNYARPGWKILDSHMGSQSSRIAAYKLGFDFYGAELDPDYYREGCKRFEEAIRMPLFDAERERKDIVQANFFDALDGV